MANEPYIIVDTSFSEVEELVDELVHRGEGDVVILPHAEAVEPGTRVNFAVNLDDGTPAFAGSGLCRTCERSEEEEFYELELDNFRVEGTHAQVLETVIARRSPQADASGSQSIFGDGAESLGVSISDFAEAPDAVEAEVDEAWLTQSEGGGTMGDLADASPSATLGELSDADGSFAGQGVDAEVSAPGAPEEGASEEDAPEGGRLADAFAPADATATAVNGASHYVSANGLLHAGWQLRRPIFSANWVRPWEQAAKRPLASSLFLYKGDGLPVPSGPPYPEFYEEASGAKARAQQPVSGPSDGDFASESEAGAMHGDAEVVDGADASDGYGQGYSDAEELLFDSEVSEDADGLSEEKYAY